MKSFTNVWKILLIIFFSLLLRIFLSNVTVPVGDILVHQEWAKSLYQEGTRGSYFREGWTYSPPTQPSLMMLAYSGSRSIYENRNVFSAMHNLLKIPPASVLLGFQKYGQILTLKIWEFLATLIIAFVFYFYFSNQKSSKIGLIIFTLILFHPILIFTNSVWGQNDLIPTMFAYISFLLIFSKYIYYSPIIFFLGVLFKPTIIVLTPLFAIVFLFFYFKNKKNFLILLPIMLIITSFLYLSFKPFIPTGISPINYVRDIYNHRISNSSKGLNLASVSAFNLYSLLFNIDKTYATKTPLISIGLLLYILINVVFIYHFLKSKNHSFSHLLFTIYFLGQGSFLLLTNMLERYFFPALLASILIMVLYWKKFGRLMLLQQLIWFLNLIYAYYHRQSEFISYVFKENNFIFVRLLSFCSLLIFFLLTKKYLILVKFKNEKFS